MSALTTVLKRGIKHAARYCIAHAATRAIVNGAYLLLPASGRKRVHTRFARIFRGVDCLADPGRWRVRFEGRGIDAPLTRESLWLDWETALSITGHDVEVKATYAAFLRGAHGPELFVDVGGNYGTHSILFLVQGIETVTFEPNPACHGAFRTLCTANGVEPNLVAAALGRERGSARLSFPEGETWLGSISGSVTRSLEREHALHTIDVERTTLDEALGHLSATRVLLKIDAEGSELDILAGGAGFIGRTKPCIVFESWPGGERRALFDSIAALAYAIHALPFDPGAPSAALPLEAFLAAPSTNFIAIAA
jgi:FkbM family methyltransferase